MVSRLGVQSAFYYILKYSNSYLVLLVEEVDCLGTCSSKHLYLSS